MGIRPKATGETIILTDTHRELVDDATATTDEFGTALGEGINEIAATAQSANSGAQELASRVKALEEALVNNGAFHVREGKLTPLSEVKWTYWGLGRIYPPVGTYWVEATVGVSVEKRGKANVRLTLPGPVTFDEGDFLLLLSMKDGQAIRLSAV